MSRFPRRALAALPLAAAGALGAAGCGARSDPHRISLWMNTQDGGQGTAITKLIDTFEKDNPGVTIQLEQRSTDDHKTALRQFAGTYLVPDIFWYWEGPGLGGELVDVGMSRDLASVYTSHDWTQRFTPSSLQGITQYGGYQGVPWTFQGEGLYYSKPLFEKAGIASPPTTYQELVAACDALVAAGITPIEFGGTVNWHVMRLLDCLIETTCGATLADSLTKGKGDWSRESAVTEAFTELKTWGEKYFNRGYMGINNDDSSQLFYTGKAAMALEGTWFNANIADNGMDPADVGVFPFPTGTGRLYGFGEGFYISSRTDKEDLCVRFLDYLTSQAGQKIAGSAWCAISVNAQMPLDTSNPLNGAWAEIFAQMDQGMFTNGDQNFSTAETTEFWRIQNAVLTGDMAPKDAGAAFQRFREQEA